MKRTVLTILLSVITIVFIFLLFSINVIDGFNRAVTDQLQGIDSPRDEIIIVKIDDDSLQSLGAWPWNRDIFAHGLEHIAEDKPAVVGYDITFFEGREGDGEFREVIEESGIPIIFASKFVDGDYLESFFDAEANAYSGYANFNEDSDGKIRSTRAYTEFNDVCFPSFSLAIFAQYLKVNSNQLTCGNKLELRNNSYELTGGSNYELNFSYIRNDFTEISFKDLMDHNYEEGLFKDKIVLVGSTALDLRNNLNDNFVNVFGEVTPGVEIHANIINSYLNKSFYYEIPSGSLLLALTLFSIVAALIYKWLKKDWYDFIFLIVSLIVVNILGFILFDQRTIFPFITVNVALITHYFLNLALKIFYERKHSSFVRNAFKQYLSPALIDKIIENPNLLKLGGESRVLTVMFSDIRSFTTLSESITPTELVELLNSYLDAMSQVIIENGGTIDKFIGDAIMAFWNAPVENEQHGMTAVKAALAMQERLKQFNTERNLPQELRIGIGLNTGEMIVGNMGSHKRFDYTVIGDNVNLGSRLEGLTKKYGITLMISESTKEQIGESSEIYFRFLDEVIVKGRTTGIKVYEPILMSIIDMEMIKNYEKGFDLYQQGKFDEATEVLKKYEDKDAPAHKLIERIEELKTPYEGWNGVWKWEEK